MYRKVAEESSWMSRMRCARPPRRLLSAAITIVATALTGITLSLALTPAATGAEVGRFAVVQNQVTSLKPGAAAPQAAILGSSISVDEQETTGPASAAKMTFGEAAVINIGQQTTFKVTREAIDQVTGKSLSGIDLSAGKVRVFVSRFLSAGREVRVNTPSAVVGIKGSEVIVQALPDGSTVVTTITGAALVTATNVTGGQREVKARETLTVRRGAGPLGLPNPIAPATVDDLRLDTDPEPSSDDPRQIRPLPPRLPPLPYPPFLPPECLDCAGPPIDPEPQPQGLCDCP